MIETIFYDKEYPAFQASGNAARFIKPFALEVCKGTGLDIGYSKREWKLPNAIGIEPSIDFTHDAMNLPDGEFDFIFSSHMLEHYKGNFANLLDYWTTKIKIGGTLFLYLPDYSQYYWRPWNNRKHIHALSPQILKDYLEQSKQYTKIFVSGIDLNNSFAVMAQKANLVTLKQELKTDYDFTVFDVMDQLKDNLAKVDELNTTNLHEKI